MGSLLHLTILGSLFIPFKTLYFVPPTHEFFTPFDQSWVIVYSFQILFLVCCHDRRSDSLLGTLKIPTIPTHKTLYPVMEFISVDHLVCVFRVSSPHVTFGATSFKVSQIMLWSNREAWSDTLQSSTPALIRWPNRNMCRISHLLAPYPRSTPLSASLEDTAGALPSSDILTSVDQHMRQCALTSHSTTSSNPLLLE